MTTALVESVVLTLKDAIAAIPLEHVPFRLVELGLVNPVKSISLPEGRVQSDFAERHRTDIN